MTDDKQDEFEVQRVIAPNVVEGRRVRADGTEDTGTLTAGSSRPLLPGEELVVAKASGPRSFKLTPFYKHPGPTRASSKKYRDGHEAVFGKNKEWN